jgi:hypothetical protein
VHARGANAQLGAEWCGLMCNDRTRVHTVLQFAAGPVYTGICGLEASFPGPIVIFLLRERNIMDMQNAWGKNSHSYVKP